MIGQYLWKKDIKSGKYTIEAEEPVTSGDEKAESLEHLESLGERTHTTEVK